jgi:fatty-acyl-CoA synthase
MQLIDYTLGEILEKWAFNTPDTEFMVYPDRDLRFTYKQFNRRVNELAKGLIYTGVQKGDKIAVWAKNVPDWTTLFFASAKIGAVLVPVNPAADLPELEFILNDAGIHTLFFAGATDGSNSVELIARIVPELKTEARGRLQSEKFPQLENVVFIGQKKQRGMYNTAELILLGSHIDEIELESAKLQVDCHDVVSIQYKTSEKKLQGVMFSHHNILNSGKSVGESLKFSAAERLLISVPLFNPIGNVLGICSVVAQGATLVFVEDFDVRQILASVEGEQCTAVYGTPKDFSEVLSYNTFSSFDLSSLRTGIIQGTNCSRETINDVITKMHMKDVVVVYGQVEASGAITATRPHNAMETRTTTIGFELPNIEIKIVDRETGNLCGVDQPGELCCRGYNVMKGYYKNPDATQKVIDGEGWFHTGSLATKGADGFYRLA